MDTQYTTVDKNNAVDKNTAVRRLVSLRASRHVALATALVVVVCAVLGMLCVRVFRQASWEIHGLDARATGRVDRVDDDKSPHSVRVSWLLPNGQLSNVTIPLAVPPPRQGTKVRVAYDPDRPRRAVIPHAAVFDTIERSATGMGLAAGLVVLVVLFDLGLLAGGALLMRRPTSALSVRRIRLQRGLNTRSWLETEHAPGRWIPVHFDPSLVSLPTPAEVRVYGDVRRNRLAAIEILASSTSEGALLMPSGPVRAGEPHGRRTDNPTEPDTGAAESAARVSRMTHQLRVDAPRLAIAPLVGLFWTILDSGGFLDWVAATTLVAAFGLWIAAIRGSDPSS